MKLRSVFLKLFLSSFVLLLALEGVSEAAPIFNSSQNYAQGLVSACLDGPELISDLLKLRANPFLPPLSGKSAIVVCSEQGKTQSVDEILAFTGPKEELLPTHLTQLELGASAAYQNGRLEILDLFKRYGVDVDRIAAQLQEKDRQSQMAKTNKETVLKIRAFLENN